MDGAELSHRTVRSVRAVLASSLATLVALASHVAAGGATPPLLLLAAVCVLAWLPALVLIGRRLSLVRQAAVVALSEALLHAAFTVGATPPVSPGPASAVMAAMPGMSGAPASAAMPAMSMPSPTMWLAHAVAATLTVVGWNRGEAAFWALVGLVQRLAVAVLLVLLSVPVLPLVAAARIRRSGPVSFHLLRVLAVHARRGPPPLVLQF